MATAIRPIGHEDRLSLVDHLEELRTRLIVSVVAFAIAFGVCFWQNHALLRIINDPYEHQTQSRVAEGRGTERAAVANPAAGAQARGHHGDGPRRRSPSRAAACRRKRGRS